MTQDYAEMSTEELIRMQDKYEEVCMNPSQKDAEEVEEAEFELMLIEGELNSRDDD